MIIKYVFNNLIYVFFIIIPKIYLNIFSGLKFLAVKKKLKYNLGYFSD